MATLTGQTIASTYDALLKVTDNGPITSSLKLITDGLGNNTALSLSNVAASINGNVTATSFIKSSGTSTQYLMADGSVSTLTNPITGTGTTNTLPKFTGASALGNSNITDSGTLISLGSNTTISSGALGIGTSSLTGYIIRIASNLTGATSTFGINNSPTIQSDVTSASRLFRTNPSTSVASFTLTNLYHFIAEQATIGAGSVVTSQYGFFVDASLIGATNNFGFRGQIPSSLNNYNLYMNGTAANYLAGDVGIGVSNFYVSSGPILTTTLTNGGSGYVDATYTDVAGTANAGVGAGSLFTVIVSGGIVTSATLTWGGANFRVGDTLTISNTLLGGTGSGLLITVATADSSPLKISNANGADITLHRADTTLTANDNLGSIKFENPDSSVKASGIQARISAFGAGTAGGGYLSFSTRSATAGTSLVEAMRIDSTGGVGIGSTTLTNFGLRLSKTITGGTTSYGIESSGVIQSDVTSNGIYFQSSSNTAATTFTTSIRHYQAIQGTFGAGSTVGTQTGFVVESTLTGATTNYGFRGLIPSGTNRWNLYMDGTANNYMAGALGIGTTSLDTNAITINRGTTGATTATTVSIITNAVSDVTNRLSAVVTRLGTDAAAFTLGTLEHYRAQQGTFGAGSTVTTQAGFAANSTLIGATNNYGFQGSIPSGTNRFNLYMDGTANNYMAGSLGIGTTSLAGYNLAVHKTITGATSAFTVSVQAAVQSDVTGSANIFFSQPGTQATTFTLPALRHFHASQGVIGAGSTLTDQMGFFASSTLIGGTNNYGFRGQVPAGTNRWNLYMDGAASNYMAGSLGIGATFLTAHNLRVDRNITGGSVSHGIYNGGIVQSDVTVQARYYTSSASTQATTFTCSDLRHYLATQGTFGAGSTVSSQAAFFVDSTLIGATNNFGFRSQLASATGRWNLYLDGTASNYLNGTTLIGSTTDNGSGAKLQVTGGISYQNIFNRRTASYTLVLTDQNDIIEMNVASANNLTIPLNATVAFPIGTEIAVLQYGAGQTTIVATVGVTLRAKANALKISGQFAGCTLVKVGTDEWYVIGDLTA
jgi:hypothetical protein